MIVIRTAEDRARALLSPLPSKIKDLLRAHLQRLSAYEEYSIEELALFIIAEPYDELAEIENACSRRLVHVGGGAATFAIEPELMRQHDCIIEAVFVLSDDGYGIVLLADLSAATDPLLLAACRHSLVTNTAD